MLTLFSFILRKHDRNRCQERRGKNLILYRHSKNQIFETLPPCLKVRGLKCIGYPIPADKDAKPFFVAPIFRYKTDIFRRREKLQSDKKKEK